MKFPVLLVASCAIFHTTALSIPRAEIAAELITRDIVNARDAAWNEESWNEEGEDLWKRKGGGGGGGRGSSGSSSSGGSSSGSSSSGSSSSGSSGSSSGSSSSGGSSSGSSRGSGSSSSNTGGRTKTGSGASRGYGGGSYYGGGSATPYRSGLASPLGITPLLLGVGALSIFPGLWLYGAYSYPYTHSYTFHNSSDTNSSNPNGANETKPVTCLCAQYAECGCDDNTNSTYMDSIIGNGSYDALNKSLVTVADVNGSSTILINGTLPNGTTASGGTSSAALGRSMMEASGYWVVVALVGCTVLMV